jgi:hypothetical protein
MSRSRKKNPVISIVCVGKGKAMRFAKKKAIRKFRRSGIEEVPDGNYYKKTDERWFWPDDGKQRWENEKAYRK